MYRMRVRARSKMLKSAMGKVLQKSLLFPSSLTMNSGSSAREVGVPGDVKEGHFAVHAVERGELRRFVVGLGFLRSPDFLRLLEQAEEEFGFRHEGAIVIPCHPNDLQRVLDQSRM